MEGKVALITGAAGGVGQATTRALAERGAVVAAVDRDDASLRESVQSSSPTGCGPRRPTPTSRTPTQ